MVKKLVCLCLLFQWHGLNAQYSFNGGLSTLKAFGIQKPYYGVHLGAEFPKDNEVSFYLRAGFYAKNRLDPLVYPPKQIYLTPIDPLDFTLVTVQADGYFNYKTIDGGMRYYLLEGYDNGMALYGGSNLMGIINKAQYKIGDFDQTKYRLPSGTTTTGTVLNIAAGLSGGAKYTFAGIGSIYFDLTFDYILAALPSNTTAQEIAGSFYSPLVFSFNFGFRKDFY
jgi:hypothetical protein